MLSHLVSKIHQYLDHAISLEELEDWLLPRLPLLFQRPDSLVARLAATVELGLAEISDNVTTEDEFRTLLEAAVQQEPIGSFYPDRMGFTESGSSDDAYHTSISVGRPKTIPVAVWG
jgi:hypothetical protein